MKTLNILAILWVVMGSNRKIPEAVTRWVQSWLSRQRISSTVLIDPLCGDGSVRMFFRIKAGPVSRVLLYDPGWTLSHDYAAHQNFLAEKGISVPRFFEIDPKEGFLLMEDLGDALVQSRILAKPREKMRWLEKTVIFLAQLHGSTHPVPKTLPVVTRSFDEQKYQEEFLFTLEHLGGLLLLPPTQNATLALLAGFCEKLAAIQPRIFCHRDYHTRNLLIKNEALYVIDFQDARMGPPHYDLASLLYDAYVGISDPGRSHLTMLYSQSLKKYPLDKELNWKAFESELQTIGLQRVLKAAGSFASFYTRFKKKGHLVYLEPALKTAGLLMKQSKVNLSAIFDIDSLLKAWKTRQKSL